jgi:hypothetical protein
MTPAEPVTAIFDTCRFYHSGHTVSASMLIVIDAFNERQIAYVHATSGSKRDRE